MRILFSFIGGTGHFLPLVPVARAAVRAGHTVAVAGAGGQVQAIRAAGFTAYATSDPPPPDRYVRSTAPLEVTDRRGAEREFAENFASRGAGRHARVLPAIIEDFQPDLLVRDEADLGAVVAAELCRVPTVSVLVLAAGTLIRPELVDPRLREVRAANGLPADPSGGRREPVLSPFPPSLRAADARPASIDLGFRSGAIEPPRAQAERPHLFVTLGTSFGLEAGDLIERLLLGLAEVSADVLVALGRHLDPAEFGPQPDHVRLEQFVEQDALVAQSDLVVSHGGSGTLLGALVHGLPQVLTPLGADQPHNAERARALGFASVLDAASVTPAEIRRAVEQALRDADLRRCARALQQEINALTDVDATVALLEASV